MPVDDCVSVGNAGGYWGDDPTALLRQIDGGQLDYVTQDFLAEITMSILQKQKARDPKLGYATDFLDQFQSVLPLLKKKGTRIISNAGGINPLACGQRLASIALEQGTDLRIAIVLGDDLLPELDRLVGNGLSLDNMETGQSFEKIRHRVLSANVYLGSAPVIKALEEGAQLVITGRVTDTAIAAAPPAFEFGWNPTDLNHLASAVVAGHILECGAHSTGGNLIAWNQVPSFQNIGYPIVEFAPDGSFTVTKHPGTGGMINRETITSQLVYEMGNPKCYLTPDVTADFTSFELEDLGGDRVRISGTTGAAPPETLKVSVAYQDGFKAHGHLIIGSPQTVAKAHRVAEILWKRLAIDFEETSTELVGYDSCFQNVTPPADPPEILLRLGVRDRDRDKVAEFARTFTSLILNTVSGIAIVGARPRIQEVLAYWPCLIPAEKVDCEVIILNPHGSFPVSTQPSETLWTEQSRGESEDASVTALEWPVETVTMPLRDLCYARSGDKGDTCNIGLVARSQEIYRWLLEHVTEAEVKDFFSEICQGDVIRYEVPNLGALNFLLQESLGGGGTASLRIDPQGKTLAEALLNMEVTAPETLLQSAGSG